MRECRMKAFTKSLAAFGSSILKFAVMLDVAMLTLLSVQGHNTPKKNTCILAELAARVNWSAAANYAFEAIFQTVSSFFTIDLLAAIGDK